MLQSMASQRVGHNLATEQELIQEFEVRERIKGRKSEKKVIKGCEEIKSRQVNQEMRQEKIRAEGC